MAVMKVPLCRPDVGKEELNAISKVFACGTLSHGPEVKEFESAFAKRVGVQYAIALNSCTSGLFLLCSYIRDKFGEGEIIVPSFTFVASVNAITCAGMIPRMVDVEWGTGNVSAKCIKPVINRKTRGIMVVHYAGRPCAMPEIMDLARSHDIPVIEDCAECLGACIDGKSVGSFGWGAFSFYSTKNITTGEGGMITAADEELAVWIRLRVAHGVSKGSYSRSNIAQRWYRNAVVPGYNFRLSNFQAAMGLEQLNKLDIMNTRRRAVAQQYTAAFSAMEAIEPPEPASQDGHSYQMYTIKVSKTVRDKILAFLNEKGVEASVHFDPPVHWQTAYFRKDLSLPVTEKLAMSTITLPISSAQTPEETKYVIDCVRSALCL